MIGTAVIKELQNDLLVDLTYIKWDFFIILMSKVNKKLILERGI